MQEMYGEDVITTADKIKRRNPKADGGQLVTPSVDGSRPGYAKQTKDFKTKQYLNRFPLHNWNWTTYKKYQEKKSHRNNTRDANLFVPWNKTESTVCPRSSDPITYTKLLY